MRALALVSANVRARPSLVIPSSSTARVRPALAAPNCVTWRSTSSLGSHAAMVSPGWKPRSKKPAASPSAASCGGGGRVGDRSRRWVRIRAVGAAAAAAKHTIDGSIYPSRTFRSARVHFSLPLGYCSASFKGISYVIWSSSAPTEASDRTVRVCRGGGRRRVSSRRRPLLALAIPIIHRSNE